MNKSDSATIYTIGHSTRSFEDFIKLLDANNVKQIVDVRTVPHSKYNPQYDQKILKKSLSKHDIKYVYLPELGGLQPKSKDSENTGWQNESFQNYADYMQMSDFTTGIDKLLSLAKDTTSAVMCAEAVPWRCHRSLIGDALLVRGEKVLDIISLTSVQPHTLTSFARVHGTNITYPDSIAATQDFPSFFKKPPIIPKAFGLHMRNIGNMSVNSLLLLLFNHLMSNFKTKQVTVDQISGADPFVTSFKDKNGKKFYLYVKSAGGSRSGKETEIHIARLNHLEDIGKVPMNRILGPNVLPNEASHEIWAPEIYQVPSYIDGEARYFIYFAASAGDNRTHRIHVAMSKTDNPVGGYEYVGALATAADNWAIDGTILKHHGNSYLIWSGWDGKHNEQQNLYIAKMAGPTELENEQVCIAKPIYNWEKHISPINEGPAILYHKNDIFLTFSASASWSDFYTIGLMKLVGDDPMQAKSWIKYDTPLMASAKGEVAPGHNSFVRDEKGHDVIAYHTARHAGAGWNRVIHHALIRWRSGLPVVVR